jgi:hypothetical protein
MKERSNSPTPSTPQETDTDRKITISPRLAGGLARRVRQNTARKRAG